jgi:hypothetical protein
MVGSTTNRVESSRQADKFDRWWVDSARSMVISARSLIECDTRWCEAGWWPVGFS